MLFLYRETPAVSSPEKKEVCERKPAPAEKEATKEEQKTEDKPEQNGHSKTEEPSEEKPAENGDSEGNSVHKLFFNLFRFKIIN